MAKKKSLLDLTCTCCGADISAPKFWKGKPYGFSCYAVVSGEGKAKKGDTFIKINVASFQIYADEITAEQAMTAKRMISVFVVCKDGKRRELSGRFTEAEASTFCINGITHCHDKVDPTIVCQDGKYYISTKRLNNWKDDKTIYRYTVENSIKYADFFTAD